MNYVLIGDIHSQYSKLQSALNFIDKNIDNYHIIFLGDTFDSRCQESDSVSVYKTIRELQNSNKATLLQSNHQWKLQRYLYGNPVTTDLALQKTIEDFKNSDVSEQELLQWLESLSFACAFRDDKGQEYRCAHAYHSSKLFIPKTYEGIYLTKIVSRKMRDKLLYGAIFNEERVLWWNEESKQDWIRCSGHYHTLFVSLENKSIVLDSCCGEDGGMLSIFNVNRSELHQF
jgi:hypothetical protein